MREERIHYSLFFKGACTFARHFLKCLLNKFLILHKQPHKLKFRFIVINDFIINTIYRKLC